MPSSSAATIADGPRLPPPGPPPPSPGTPSVPPVPDDEFASRYSTSSSFLSRQLGPKQNAANPCQPGFVKPSKPPALPLVALAVGVPPGAVVPPGPLPVTVADGPPAAPAVAATATAADDPNRCS